MAGSFVTLGRAFLVMAVGLLTACSSPTVSDADPTADFSSYQTYAFLSDVATDKAAYETLERAHLKAAVGRELNARGYRQDNTQPDLLVNFGASRFSGGLNLAATLLGKPGKIEVQGYMVQDLYDQGRLNEIHDYCRCDVLDTYFVFLRCSVLTGDLPLDQEQQLVAQTKQWLADQAEASAAYRLYLEKWGDWSNPWEVGED